LFKRAEIWSAGSAGLLVTAFFLVFQEPDWTGWKLASGYRLADRWIAGVGVAGFHAGLHLAGLTICLALALARRRPVWAVAALVAFGLVWLICALEFWTSFWMLSGMAWSSVWKSWTLVALGLLAVLSWIAVRRRTSPAAVVAWLWVIATAAAFEWLALLAFAWIEDQVGLGPGAWVAGLGVLGLLLTAWLARAGVRT
jgi:hypothetical protein